ncbi:MAG: GYDIA family GHMP kinase [Bacteroidota bacterium]
MSIYHAHGKLLLTAEYFVLDGATALALPVKYGQSLDIATDRKDENLHWQSLDEKGNCWFEATFDPSDFSIIDQNDEAIAIRLQSILKELKTHHPPPTTRHSSLKTYLSFPRSWGLGTSSTLIYLLAKWAGADPFDLQFKIFGGSGYDIACAGAEGPILYQLKNKKPFVEGCEFSPSFADRIFFVYLGKKQNSRKGIARYRAESSGQRAEKRIAEISALTDLFLKEKTPEGFEKLIVEHEKLVGSAVGLPRAKSVYFNDFWGEVKSLGAWGGDFVLVTSDRPAEETKDYFNEKGFEVFIPYREMVL